ncbi:hypothetical protein B0H63DRAFT_505307 [Podospora didyma]|uniref:(4-O-methyl)-D-glucuronate--lignin esterase n=1 Tax=Podospora didyma TaxID=330526 RepID=A0AAE0P4S3_9PEZI|nr:hypothetical protein B0H63DRAFT_505307 [Podospora didyma]
MPSYQSLILAVLGAVIENQANCQLASSCSAQYELGNLPPPPDSVTATISGNSMSLSIKVGSNSKTISVSITKPSNGGSAGGPAVIGVGGASIPSPNGVGKITFGNDAYAAQSSPSSHGTGWFLDQAASWLMPCFCNIDATFCVVCLTKHQEKKRAPRTPV